MALLFFSVYCYLFNCNDALEAEIHALMIGTALARQHTELPIMVRSDPSTTLSCLSNSSLDRSAFGHLVAEIKSLMIDRVFIPEKLHRFQNSVADCLARYSRSERATAMWHGRGPHVLMNSC